MNPVAYKKDYSQNPRLDMPRNRMQEKCAELLGAMRILAERRGPLQLPENRNGRE